MAKAATKSSVEKTKDTVKKPATKAKKAVNSLSDQERYEHIQYAAYMIAEKNGFAGDSYSYWLQAEAQVNNQ